jgi:hypothetical protein
MIHSKYIHHFKNMDRFFALIKSKFHIGGSNLAGTSGICAQVEWLHGSSQAIVQKKNLNITPSTGLLVLANQIHASKIAGF